MDSIIKAIVVKVEYSGHDATASLDSLWDSSEGAQHRADELTQLNEEFGDEQAFVIEFSAVEGEVIVRS